MSKRITVQIKSDKHLAELKLEAKMLHTSLSEIIRRRIFNRDNLSLTLTTRKQYQSILSQLSQINQMLTSIGVDTKNERSTVDYSLLAKAKEKSGLTLNLQIAEAMVDDDSGRIMKQLLAYDSQNLEPRLKKLSLQFLELKNQLKRIVH